MTSRTRSKNFCIGNGEKTGFAFPLRSATFAKTTKSLRYTLKYFTKLNEIYSKKYGYVSVLFFSSSVGCATSKHESHQKNGEHTAISSPYAVTVAS